MNEELNLIVLKAYLLEDIPIQYQINDDWVDLKDETSIGIIRGKALRIKPVKWKEMFGSRKEKGD